MVGYAEVRVIAVLLSQFRIKLLRRSNTDNSYSSCLFLYGTAVLDRKSDIVASHLSNTKLKDAQTLTIDGVVKDQPLNESTIPCNQSTKDTNYQSTDIASSSDICCNDQSPHYPMVTTENKTIEQYSINDCAHEDQKGSSHSTAPIQSVSMVNASSIDCVHSCQDRNTNDEETPQSLISNRLNHDQSPWQHPPSSLKNHRSIFVVASTDGVWHGQSSHLALKTDSTLDKKDQSIRQPHKADFLLEPLVNTDDLTIQKLSSTDCLYKGKPYQSSQLTDIPGTVVNTNDSAITIKQPSSTDCLYEGNSSQPSQLTLKPEAVVSTHDTAIKQPTPLKSDPTIIQPYSTNRTCEGRPFQSSHLTLASGPLLNVNDSMVTQPTSLVLSSARKELSSTDCIVHADKPYQTLHLTHALGTVVNIDGTIRQPSSTDSLYKNKPSAVSNELIQLHSDTDNRAAAKSSLSRAQSVESISVSRSLDKEDNSVLVNPTSPRTIRDILDKNTSIFPHGKLRTLTALISAIAALVLGIICKNSTDNLVMQNPIFIGPLYKDVTKIGLFYIDLCLINKMESTYLDANVTTVVHVEFLDKEAFSSGVGTLPLYTDKEISSNAPEKYDMDDTVNQFDDTDVICRKLKLGSDVVRDDLWNLSRLSVGLSVSFGYLMTAILTTTVVWKTINLLPVIVGLFVTYLCQGLTFFLFDSELCAKYGCNHGKGTIFAIASCVCWFVSGVAVIIMQYCSKQNTEQDQEQMQKILNVQRSLFHSSAITNLDKRGSLTCSSSSSEELVENPAGMDDSLPPV